MSDCSIEIDSRAGEIVEDIVHDLEVVNTSSKVNGITACG